MNQCHIRHYFCVSLQKHQITFRLVGSIPPFYHLYVTADTDTGAQSCLWGVNDFYRCGFRDSDLIPVNRTIVTANHEEMEIRGAIMIRLSGVDNDGIKHTAPIMVYVTPNTKKIYLSRQALVQLHVIPENFPKVGAATEVSSIYDVASKNPSKTSCGCPLRSKPPERWETLPFPAIPENNEKMKNWLLEKFRSSTFNKCTHQELMGMAGPPVSLHVDPDAVPVAHNTPANIPLHWQDDVEKQLLTDVALGVAESVPEGETTKWCHRMVVVRKPDGGLRRAIDFSALKKVSLRDVHRVKPPFQQARSIPPGTWKSVTDAWNGYHSIPIREDRHYTTFITPWGRFRYRMLPQGFLASGDKYSRRYDDIIADVERKSKCVDDTIQWDEDLETHWWRVIDFLILVGRNGIILNPGKFQFPQKEVNFAGSAITDTEDKPLTKYLKAIAEFPTPERTIDIRAWFGLVHQVSIKCPHRYISTV